MSLDRTNELDGAEAFLRRHIGVTPDDAAAMLTVIGAADLDALIGETVPQTIRDGAPLALGEALTETEAIARLRAVAGQNKVLTSLIGQGYSGTILPAVIQRNILESPAWYTAYTPYQPEISQGRLEALLNFQTMISDLTGLDTANASLLDEPTAAAEAMTMAHRVATSKAPAFFIDRDVHPQTLAVVRTRAEPLDIPLIVGDPETDLDASAVFGVLLQYPGTLGQLRDLRPVIERVHRAGGIAAVAADLLALAVLVPPGEMGADIVVGSTQRFGMPFGYGGPHAAYMATATKYVRSLPGRIVGVSVDARGAPAYRLALQTREQHIRREKATSNICTAQVLPAVIASMYAVYHGPKGLAAIARRVHALTAALAHGLRQLGQAVVFDAFFDTVAVDVGSQQDAILKRAVDLGINLRAVPAQGNAPARLAISLDETTTPAIVETVWRAFGGTLRYAAVAGAAHDAVPAALQRKSAYLTHPVFNLYHSETEILRYMRRLADRDLALDRAMIPLGSCTMKLNATTEMMPITWPEFANIHPYVPADQARGYHEMVADLERKLCAITGYDAVSLQPNSGAQGEYAGLLAIRAYHRSRGEANRTVCLIPSSAHGTNPASAQMAGLTVVVVKCDAQGNVDLADLKVKLAQHSANLAAIMITYPSTHGVFEEGIREICDLVHAHGGQVYLDGANLNAQVGLARPGCYGADVSHLNLHKTFCIPHGGGGPGAGPIGVRSHLAPFLPGNPNAADGSAVGPVAGAHYGSASILLISWCYILMMAGRGLTAASEIAILNANYIASRLAPHYPVLYQGRQGRVAHECILDLRPIKDETGVTVEDVAKRLIDYGFHAPTMSFPVPGTLMIEPTESESKAELDRFCDAMIAIRREIAEIKDGRRPLEGSALRHAPHTVYDLADAEWNRSYSREEGCFPHGARRTDKYWSPVNRVDNVYGDRNLMCSCPPLSAYDRAAE